MKKFLITICVYIGIVGIGMAETMNINWIVDDSVYDTSTCTVGGDIILPDAPTKYGYTFTGWSLIYDLSTLNTAIDGDAYYAFLDTGSCWYQTSSMSNYSDITCTDNNFTDLSAGLWKVNFNYGTVYGTSKCSNTAGTITNELGNPEDSKGKYCWCRATGFIPHGEDLIYAPAVSLWVFRNQINSASNCAAGCANACGFNVRASSVLRSVIYGSN